MTENESSSEGQSTRAGKWFTGVCIASLALLLVLSIVGHSLIPESPFVGIITEVEYDSEYAFWPDQKPFPQLTLQVLAGNDSWTIQINNNSQLFSTDPLFDSSLELLVQELKPGDLVQMRDPLHGAGAMCDRDYRVCVLQPENVAPYELKQPTE